MGVEQEHVEYTKFLPVWTRCNDAVSGADEIKGKGQTYLPKLPGMNLTSDGDNLYKIFLENALWYPGTGRTYAAYLGTMFRKPSSTEIPTSMDEVEEVFTPDGQTMDGFAVEVAGEVVKGYRPGILVDYPSIDTEGMTQAEAEAAGARPYSLLYPADSIVNWEQTLIDGHLITTLVVIEETATIDKAEARAGDLPKSRKLKESGGYATFRRELILTSDDESRVYRQNLYVQVQDSGKRSKNNTNDSWYLIDSRTPTKNGQALDFIPFIPITQTGLIWQMRYPMINEIAVLNIADYRNEALYRDALLFNGRPTPCVSGLIKNTPNQKYISLGSSNVLQFETDGSWGTLGGGADAVGLKDSGTDLKTRMALVGSRALAEDPNGVEAAETAAIHRQGEDGILSSVAKAVSDGMTKALEIMRDWWTAEVTGDVSYTVNSDFVPLAVDASRMTAIWTMLQSGSISYSTFFSYLQRGEVYKDGWTEEDEIEAIKETDEAAKDRLNVGTDDLAVGDVEEAVKVATLSGIQIEAANTIIQSVASGALTRAAAINQLVVFLGLTSVQANQVMEGVEEGSLVADTAEAGA